MIVITGLTSIGTETASLTNAQRSGMDVGPVLRRSDHSLYLSLGDHGESQKLDRSGFGNPGFGHQ